MSSELPLLISLALNFGLTFLFVVAMKHWHESIEGWKKALDGWGEALAELKKVIEK